MARHAQGDGAPGLAEVPAERRLRAEDDRQPAGPELVEQRADARGRRSASASRVACPGISTGGGDCAAAPLRVEQALHGAGFERVGGDAVHRVGREHDELAASDRAPRIVACRREQSLEIDARGRRREAMTLTMIVRTTWTGGRQGSRLPAHRRRRTIATGEVGVRGASGPPAVGRPRRSRIAPPCSSPCSMTSSSARGAAGEGASSSRPRARRRGRRLPRRERAQGRAGAPRGRAGPCRRDVGRVGRHDRDGPSSSGSASARPPSTSLAFPAPTARCCGAPRRRRPARALPRRRRRGTSVAMASAMAPLPVPRSTATGRAPGHARSASIASWATPSVSGRGTKTPGPTCSSSERKAAGR